MRQLIILIISAALILNSCKTSKQSTRSLPDGTDTIGVVTVGVSDSVKLEIVKTETLPSRQQDTYLDKAVGTISGEDKGRRIIKDDKMYIVLENGKTFEVEPYPYTLISGDGQTIIQYGDRSCIDYCMETDILFYNSDGELQRKYTKLPQGIFDLSDNGYFARIFNQDTLYKEVNNCLSVFDPKGDEILIKSIEKGCVAHNVKISDNAKYIAISYFLAGKYDDRNLLVIDNKGRKVLEFKENIGITGISFMENNSYLGVYADAFIYFFDLNTLKLLWKVNALPYVDMKNPMIALEKKGLFLTMETESDQVVSGNKVSILVIDLRNGQLVSKIELPNRHTFSHAQGFFYNEKNGIEFSTDNSKFFLNINKE